MSGRFRLIRSGAVAARDAARDMTPPIHSHPPSPAVFRDDVVFLIFIYQRWIYRVDKKRVNEFG